MYARTWPPSVVCMYECMMMYVCYCTPYCSVQTYIHTYTHTYNTSLHSTARKGKKKKKKKARLRENHGRTKQTWFSCATCTARTCASMCLFNALSVPTSPRESSEVYVCMYVCMYVRGWVDGGFVKGLDDWLCMYLYTIHMYVYT